MGKAHGNGAAGQRGSSSKSQQIQTTPGRTLSEVFQPGPFPRFELGDWLQRYGVVAGITGRGSDSDPDFDLGLWSRQPVGEVMSRWLAFRREMAEFTCVTLGNQVHGIDVMRVDGGRGWVYVDGIDGWITTRPGTLLAVTVADCIPVYLLAPGRGIALLHAGWRGTARGILDRGLGALLGATQASVGEVVMHCGIGICGNCYEVGSEVMAGCGVPAEGPGPWHLDLRLFLADRAQRLGVCDITISAWCSAHDRRFFYSHRASGGADGRMVAYLGLSSRLASNPLHK